MAGLTTSFSVGQMQMTDYQNKQAKQSTTNNTTPQEPIDDINPSPNGTDSAPNDTVGDRGRYGDDTLPTDIVCDHGRGDDSLKPSGGMSTIFSIAQMQMTDYQNADELCQLADAGLVDKGNLQAMLDKGDMEGTVYAHVAQMILDGDTEGLEAFKSKGGDNGIIAPQSDVPSSPGMSTIFSIGQMQMTDYQNAQAIAESIPQMDMNDYLELKDNMPTEGSGGMTSVFAVGRMQMVDYQNAESLYRMADSGLLDKDALQEMVDSGEFEGTVYAQVAQQILDGDTEGLESWGFQDVRDKFPATGDLPKGGGSPGMSTIFTIGRIQMVDYQDSNDLVRLARNGLLDVDALQERYDNGELSGMYNETAASILNGEEE